MLQTQYKIAILSLGLTFLMSAGLSVSASATTPPLPQKKQITKQAVQQNLKELQKKEKDLKKQVSKIQTKLVKTSQDIQRNERALGNTTSKLSHLTRDKQKLMTQLSQDQDALSELVLALARLSRKPTEMLLFSGTAPLDTARQDMALKSVLPYVQEDADIAMTKLSEINAIQIDIKKQRALYEVQKRSLSSEKKKLSSLLNTRKSLYQSTSKQRQAQAVEAERLAKKARDLESLVKALPSRRKPDFKPKNKTVYSNNNMALPAVGSIKTSFGQTDSLGAKSKGISLATRQGAQVTTPMDGTVRFAGPFQHYKQLLIIEHKQGYHSLIGGMGRIDVDIGTHLIAGEPVGTMGQTSAKEPKLYYELRHHGKPVNPVSTLTAQYQNKRKG